jgi:hypothetical protein
MDTVFCVNGIRRGLSFFGVEKICPPVIRLNCRDMVTMFQATAQSAMERFDENINRAVEPIDDNEN